MCDTIATPDEADAGVYRVPEQGNGVKTEIATTESGGKALTPSPPSDSSPLF